MKRTQIPNDRPPPSKGYLAGREKKRDLCYKADSYYSRKKVRVKRENVVEEIDTANQTATLSDGEKISFKTLLIAPGGVVRKLEKVPGSDLEGIYYLRTLEDCDVIRENASNARSKQVVVVGGGFIGCEAEATLRSKGADVTLIQRSPQLLSSAMDEETPSWIRWKPYRLESSAAE